MKTEQSYREEDIRPYDARPILMTDEVLKETLRRADAECIVRKHERATGRTLRVTERERLEGIAFRSLSVGNSEQHVIEELKRVTR